MYINKALNKWFNNFMFYFYKIHISIGLCDLQNFNAMLSEDDVNSDVSFLYFMKKIPFFMQHSFSLRGRGEIYISRFIHISVLATCDLETG